MFANTYHWLRKQGCLLQSKLQQAPGNALFQPHHQLNMPPGLSKTLPPTPLAAQSPAKQPLASRARAQPLPLAVPQPFLISLLQGLPHILLQGGQA